MREAVVSFGLPADRDLGGIAKGWVLIVYVGDRDDTEVTAALRSDILATEEGDKGFPPLAECPKEGLPLEEIVALMLSSRALTSEGTGI